MGDIPVQRSLKHRLYEKAGGLIDSRFSGRRDLGLMLHDAAEKIDRLQAEVDAKTAMLREAEAERDLLKERLAAVSRKLVEVNVTAHRILRHAGGLWRLYEGMNKQTRRLISELPCQDCFEVGDACDCPPF